MSYVWNQSLVEAYEMVTELRKAQMNSFNTIITMVANQFSVTCKPLTKFQPTTANYEVP